MERCEIDIDYELCRSRLLPLPRHRKFAIRMLAALIRLRKERFRVEIGRLQESSALSTAAC